MKISSILGIALTAFISTAFAGPNCGKGLGICPEGKCCSKYGYCGTSSDHCDNSKGCQTEYGICTKSMSKGHCGKDYGRCAKSSQCCSKSGYCGTSSDYCGSGCQSAFGTCSSSSSTKVEEKVQEKEEEEIEWVTEWVTETVYVYVEEKGDSRDCGSDVGKQCPSGKCCSKYGYCGTSAEYCEVSKGCQAKYGDCYEVVDLASVNAETIEPECGKGIGSCVDGKCCSKDGFCGTSTEFCDVKQGCQEEFGLCNSQSEKGQCGENFGRCPQPTQCCSKDGYCGISEDYCGKSKGCQSDYGLCIEFDVDVSEDEDAAEAASKKPECGKDIGSCPNGQCCSKEGFCGVTYEFCKADKGCQKEYGECYSEDSTGKCGEGYGRCPSSEQCCSKEGFCGTTEAYCLPTNGCQEKYGKCDPTTANEFKE